MPKTTHEEGAPLEPPPAEARDEFADLSLRPNRESALGAAEELSDSTEAELLALMSRQHSDPQAARSAWDEMYRRHSRYVMAVVARAFYDRARDADALTDIV